MDNGPFLSALERMGLIKAGETPLLTPLVGGVSSDIVRVDLAQGPVCIKRALAKLQVDADWQAPVERNRWEHEWLRTAATIVPHAVPKIIAEDTESGMFAMEYLDVQRYPVWKDQLRDGTIETTTAAEVGRRIGAIHSATSDRADITSRTCLLTGFAHRRARDRPRPQRYACDGIDRQRLRARQCAHAATFQ